MTLLLTSQQALLSEEYWSDVLPRKRPNAVLSWALSDSTGVTGRTNVRAEFAEGVATELLRMCASSPRLLATFAGVALVEVLRRCEVVGPIIGMMGFGPSIDSMTFVHAEFQEQSSFKAAFVLFRERFQQGLKFGSDGVHRVLEERGDVDESWRAMHRYGICSDGVEGSRREVFEICLVVDSDAKHLELEFAGHFDAQAMRFLLDRVARCVESSVAAPYNRLEHYDLLGEAERALVTRQFNSKRAPLPDGTLPELIRRQARRQPTAIALEQAQRSLTYAELDEQVLRLAGHLCERVAPGETIVVLMDRSIEMVISILATWWARCAYLPIDAQTPVSRVQAITASAKPAAVLTKRKFASTFDECWESSSVLLSEDWGILETKTADREPRFDDPAYVIYTSGSTGLPKGAQIEHGGMLNHVEAKVSDLGLSAESIVAQTASQCFDISVWQFFAALRCGGKTVIFDDHTILDPASLWAEAERRRATILELVPSYLSVSLDVLERDLPTLESLRYLLVTGETVSASLVSRWFQRFPDVPVVNAYGPTEAGDDITHHVMREAPAGERISLGVPIQNMNVYVVDRHQRLCPIGVKGEITVSGIGVGRGYLGDPERTAAAFGVDPFRGEGERLYRTGDLGCWSLNGELEFFGRMDRQVKVRGFRVELEEVELAVNAHPDVAAAAVVDVTDGAGSQLHCFVVSNETLGSSELKEFVAKRLPDYMVPTRIVFVTRLPITTTGKIDRVKLRTQGASEQVEKDARTATSPGLDDRSRMESRLRALWSQALRKPDIGDTDDFFDLGGDSLKAIRIAAEYGPGLHALDLLNHPTIKALSQHLLQGSNGEVGLLHWLTPPIANPRLTILGVANGGGNPMSFKEAATKLSELTDDVALLGVALPREFLEEENAQSALAELDRLTSCLADEVEMRVPGPVVVFGQCNGSAVALALAEKLQARNRTPVAVSVGGMLPRTLMDHEHDPFRNDKDRAGIMAFVQYMGGTLPEDPDALEFFLRDVRYDNGLANAYFNDAVRRHRRGEYPVFNAPLYCMIGDRDPLTKHYRWITSRWLRFARSVHLVELPGIGHYILRDAPDAWARTMAAVAAQEPVGQRVRRKNVLARLIGAPAAP